MNKAQKIFGIALACFGALVLLIILLWLVWPRGGGLRDPDVLAEIALTGATDEEKNQAILELATYHKTNPRVEQAKAALRRVLNESSESNIKAAAIQGIGALEDWEAMPKLLKCLSDPDLLIRGRAGVAVTQMLGVRYGFKAEDDEERRETMVKSMTEIAEAYMKQMAKK